MTSNPLHGRTDRRAFLQAAGAGVVTLLAGGPRQLPAAPDRSPRPQVAAVFTVMTYRSHAHVILENFLEPYLFNGQVISPEVDVVSFHADQSPRDDMVPRVAADYGIPVYKSISAALCRGGKELAVDGVLLIGEHGDYPVNDQGQREYPRKRFFDACVDVFRRSGRAAAVFSDKHLSYRWDWAREMYDVSRELHMPLMAGSSVPLAQRRPPLELPEQAPIEEAVSIHGGPFESYDIHALEVLQSLVEARAGGETGVSRVQFLNADELWAMADRGEWSPELADAAMAAELGPDTLPVRELLATEPFRRSPAHGIQILYRDGLRAMVLKVGDSGTRWNFACRLKGDKTPLKTSYYVGPWQNRNLFKALSHAIQSHFRQHQPPYPVERTLLTTGILCAAVDSRAQGGIATETPQLAIAYPATDFRSLREMGDSWKLLTESTPEPPGITRGGDIPRL